MPAASLDITSGSRYQVGKFGYPIVECADHPGERAPGYMLCQHIKTALDIDHFERASPKDLGVVCCSLCHENRNNVDYGTENFRIICASCLRARGFLIDA